MTTLRGKVSHFGGPDDMGVSPSEGLAFIYKVEDAPWLFLPSQPPGTTGLARRLDPEVYYVATRWDYDDTPKTMLPTMGVLVRAPKTGREFMAFCADWGPNINTGRVADISPGLMAALGIQTDDAVEVIYPYEVEEHVMPRIAMSSGHSTRCQGAVGYINEVEEATKVVDQTAAVLREMGVQIATFHDTISTTQNENLNRIVNWHNAQQRDVDCSVHFNAYQTTSKPMGVECLYITAQQLADDVSDAIAEAAGFIDRGPKKRTDLFFLNNTEMPAILIEVCFVDSQHDVNLYRGNFNAICRAIAEALTGQAITEPGPPQPPITTETKVVITVHVDAPPGVVVEVLVADE